MMRDALVQIRTTEENKAKLEESAEQLNQSLSEYGHHLIERHVASMSQTDEPEQLRTEQSAVDILEEIHEEMTAQLAAFQSETVEELLYVHSVRTAHLIALWKLLEDDYSPAERRYAMQFGAAHAGIESEVLADDGPPDAETSDAVPPEHVSPALSSVVEMLGDDR